MDHRFRSIAILYLIGLVTLAAPSDRVRAQPSVEEDQAARLHRLIFEVESQRKVLVRSRGALIAISAEQVGELFSSQVLSGAMPVDSIAYYARRVREMSNVWLADIRRQLAGLQGDRSLPSGVAIEWIGVAGTWSMACTGRYPPTIRGDVARVSMTQVDFRAPSLRVDLTGGMLHAPFASLTGTVVNNSARGEARSVEIPGNDSDDLGTLEWDAFVQVTSPAAKGVQGSIAAGGALSLGGNDGRCEGRWRSP